METAGLAVGVIALAGLFNNAVDCFDYLQIGRSLGRDYHTGLLKLDVAKLRLTRWGQAVGLGPTLDNATSLQSTTLSVESISVAERVLGQVLALFENAQAPKIFQQNASTWESLDSADGSDAALTSLHRKMRGLAIRRQGKAGLREKAKWALHGGKQFSRLIEDIRDLVTELEGLLPAADVQRLCEVDISKLDPGDCDAEGNDADPAAGHGEWVGHGGALVG
jgi:hypothetical protein